MCQLIKTINCSSTKYNNNNICLLMSDYNSFFVEIFAELHEFQIKVTTHYIDNFSFFS